MHAVVGIFAAVFVALMPLGAAAQGNPKEIVLASEEWRNATNADGTGLYWELFKATFEPEGIRVKPLIRSYAGAVKLVKSKKADALVGSYKDEVKGALFPKSHFGTDEVAVVFKKANASPWKGEQTLSGKRVGWIAGYSYDKYLKVPVQKKELDKRKEAFRMLEKGRIDYFMDARGDLVDAQSEGLFNPASYAMEDVMKLDLYLAFADTPSGRKLMEIFDRRFPELVKSGKAKELYEKWAKGNFRYPF